MAEISLNIKYDDHFCDTAEVWMKAVVDGIEQDFILDTGCATTSLCHNEYSAKYNSLKTNEYSSAFGRAFSDTIEIRSITAGPISQSTINISRTRPGGNDKNLLGMDLLKDWIIQLNLKESRLLFHPEMPAKVEQQHSLYLDSGSIPLVDVYLDVPLNLSHLGPMTGRGMDFILGFSTLRYAEWVMDFKNKKWGFANINF